MISESDIFHIISNFVNEKGLISHQIDSYNYLIETYIQKIFDDIPTITVNYKKSQKYIVNFGQVYVDYPTTQDENKKYQILYPSEARLRDLTYESTIHVDIKEKIINTETQETEEKIHFRVPIARIPIMIGCGRCNIRNKTNRELIELGECENDIGGYFIIRGKERVLISQERINYNQIYIFEQKNGQQKYDWIAEIRSISEETAHSVLTQAKIGQSGRSIVFSLPYIKIDVPVGIVFKALGFSTYEEINMLLGNDDKFKKFIVWIIRNAKQTPTTRDALSYIGSNPIHSISDDKKIEYAQQILENEVFPHLGYTDKLQIAMYLGNMVSKLIYTMLGLRKEDDRDNISLKRVECAGTLVGDLFRMLLKRFIDTAKKYIVKRPDITSVISRLNNITTGIRYSFATGNWGVQKNTYIRTGVCQILSRLTYSSTISHLRRVIIPIGKEGKNTKIRQLHSTQAFFICPCESPDGQSIGILKNLAFMSRITQPISNILIRDIVRGFSTVLEDNEIGSIKIYNNGILIGFTIKPRETILEFKNLRKLSAIPQDVSISYDSIEKEIHIFSDDGRFSRPVFTLQDNKLCILGDPNYKQLSWNELIQRGYIQYIDSNEVENSVIAMTPTDLQKSVNYDYCEIHPSLMLGIAAIVIPYSDHNQSPRNCYQTGMLKQALGVYALSHNQRTDTITYTLDYPQKPLITSPYGKMLKFDEMPYGINAIVAVACYTGYNQEDSVMLNRASIERGLFVTHSYRTIVIEEKKKNSNNYETIQIPPLEIRNKNMCYSKLGVSGIVQKGSIILKNDIIVGKVLTKIVKEDKEEQTDISVVVKGGEEGVVDNIFITTNLDGVKIIKIRIRNIKIPEVGDKFSSRYAQKGVAGMIFNPEDLPFTDEGIIPDIVINPQCFVGDTLVTQTNGLSKRIDSFSQNGMEPLMTWNNTIKSSFSLGMEYKGVQNTIKITLSDNRTIVCTPDHKIKIKNGNGYIWREAEKLTSSDKILVGIRGTEDINYGDEDEWCDHYQNIPLSMNQRDRALAISRILGFRTFMEKCPTNALDSHSIYMDLVVCDSNNIINQTTIPEFIYRNPPKSIAREYLAGLFASAQIEKDGIYLFFTWEKYRKTFMFKFSILVSELLENFGIDCTLNYHSTYAILTIKNIELFREKIGIRHCLQKIQQLDKYCVEKYTPPLEPNNLIYHLTIKNIEIHSPAKVYDIGVATTHMFMANGIVVSNCLPSRMTVGQLIECLLAKKCCQDGTFGDSTPFTESSRDPIKHISQELRKYGYDRFGNERMYNGMTGELIESEIFIGPTYYQRLKHMVSDKQHCRAIGNVTVMVRQPHEGRSRDGGLKLGEMEKDSLVSHGTSIFLKERLYDMSDPFTVKVCVECGNFLSGIMECLGCKGEDISLVNIPYACKLLLQELNAMNIKTRIILK